MKELWGAQLEKDFGVQEKSPFESLRQASFQKFKALGFPTTDQEAWRYTNVEPMTQIPFKRVAMGKENAFQVPEASGHRLVFCNGHFIKSLSSQDVLPTGVLLGSLSEFIRTHPQLVEPLLNRMNEGVDHPFVHLNTAFLSEGAFIYLPRGTILESPLQLLFLSGGTGGATVSHLRNLIIVEAGSQVKIVEGYVGGTRPEGARTLTNSLTQISIGSDALVEHDRWQNEQSFHIGMTHVWEGRQSRYLSNAINLGGELTRHEIHTHLDAEGAECTLNGLYVATGKQHIDNQTDIDHAKPHGTSRELYKGILGDQAKGVFNGRIVVRPNAQQTSARQINKNLVLSDDVVINTKPLLEIFANDVKCNHGATIGRIDENSLFYLRSRGIPLEEARSLLTCAFAQEMLDPISVGSLRRTLQGILSQRLGQKGQWVEGQ